MKRGAITLFLAMIILLTIPTIQASGAEWPYTSETITADTEVTSGVTVIRTGMNSYLDNIEANLSFVPKETETQTILRESAEPKPEKTGDQYLFRWKGDLSGNIFFRLKTRVQTKNKRVKVKEEGFPIRNVPENIKIYLKPSKTIDSGDPAITAQASKIAAGETDLYGVVFKTAEWTRKNINYNLSTLTAKASQSASWTLKNRNGVCDEITTIFIALLRAVGIPAKFVSGVAYTDSPLFPKNWGGHGWAEVYFPKSGWVPFDVTYAQYGWIDPTHIKFQENKDSAAPSVQYQWLGRDIDVITKDIEVNAKTLDHKGKTSDPVNLKLSAVQKTTGIGSYNLIEADITNKIDSYVSTFVYLSNIKELEVPEGNMKAVYLKPKETKSVYWLVRVDPNLEEGYTYEFPLMAGTIMNTTAKTSFDVTPEATVFSKEEMQMVKDAWEEDEKSKTYAKEIEITCDAGEYYVYEEPIVTCKVKNTGNYPFKTLNFCFFDECEEEGLAIAQEATFKQKIKRPKAGINKIKFSVTGKDISKTTFYDLKIMDEPNISIEEYDFPKTIEYQKDYKFSFLVKKRSESEPVNMTLEFDAAGSKERLEEKELTGDKRYVFSLNSEDLTTKPNKFVIKINYYDKNGKLHTLKEEKEINLINVTFGQKMIIFLKQLDKKLRNIFKS